ncbi:MAG: glutamine synthetase family protein, partial [Thermomicrobiales bacterium]
LSDRERNKLGMARLPTSLDEALDNLERDTTLIAALGETMAAAYIAVRRSEAIAYDKMEIEDEFRDHIDRF